MASLQLARNEARSGRRVVPEAVIRVRGLAKRFGGQVVFEDLGLDVWRGEILAVVGASGTGKSVLLRCLAGLEPMHGGRIEIFGRDVAGLSPVEQLAVNARWGILFQDGALFGALTVLENIQVPMREHLRLPADTMDELAYLKLALVGLPPEAALKMPSELSGGMRKRVGLARTLVYRPEILLYDEPTTGLDPIAGANIDGLIRRVWQEFKVTSIAVTHDMASARRISNRILMLHEGTIYADGSTADILASTDPVVNHFVNGIPSGKPSF